VERVFLLSGGIHPLVGAAFTAADPAYVDYYGRPWAKDWEKYFEVGWEKPQTDLPQDILDIFK
jgi:hypothetical protein